MKRLDKLKLSTVFAAALGAAGCVDVVPLGYRESVDTLNDSVTVNAKLAFLTPVLNGECDVIFETHHDSDDLCKMTVCSSRGVILGTNDIVCRPFEEVEQEGSDVDKSYLKRMKQLRARRAPGAVEL